jgi:2-oxoisovalerate dehydrogenase E1 component beta subunit
VEQVPIDDFELPLGQADILIPGSDLTLLTWGTPVYHCEAAVQMLSAPASSLEPHIPSSFRSAKIELIDLRSILPWDVETITESVNRTGRLVIVHEAGLTAGVGAEISAEVQKRCFLKLNAPVRRVAGWECVQSFYFFCKHVTDQCLCDAVRPLRCNTRSSIYLILSVSLMQLWRH